MTQMSKAMDDVLTPEMEEILKKENLSEVFLIQYIKAGKIAIIPSKTRNNHIAIGDSLTSKILSNIGTSSNSIDSNKIFEFVKIVEKNGASIICDQSSGPNFFQHREKLLKATSLPLAAIPLYQNAERSLRKHGDPLKFSATDLINTFKEQLQSGVSAPGIHPITIKLIDKIDSSDRIIPYVSRGGTISAAWMKKTGNENPYVSHLDEILDLCVEFDVPLTFVCATRSGCLEDGLDKIQIEEWKIIGDLVKKAHRKKVSAIVDGIGHLRMDLIPKAVKILKTLTYGIPVGVMGPATNDRSLGMDHISHALGAAIAVQHGANYCQVCCRTEHIGLPEKQDIIEALHTYKTVLYSADLSKLPYLRKIDQEISIARAQNHWGKQLSLSLINSPYKIHNFFILYRITFINLFQPSFNKYFWTFSCPLSYLLPISSLNFLSAILKDNKDEIERVRKLTIPKLQELMEGE